MSSACPSRHVLAQIGAGAGLESCPAEVSAHIEGCPRLPELPGALCRARPGIAGRPQAALPVPEEVPRIDGFTIERELGRGSMGVVYLARREAPRRHVALKLLPGGRRSARTKGGNGCAKPRRRRKFDIPTS